MARTRWLCLALLVGSTACYHQVVNTGRPEADTVIDIPWAHGWAWGIVGPKPIETRTRCPRGVASVVSETTVENGIATILTLGIYTPQHVRITCARGGASSSTESRR